MSEYLYIRSYGPEAYGNIAAGEKPMWTAALGGVPGAGEER